MRRWISPLLLLVLLVLSSTCAAQTAIHHCVSAAGTPIFTDQSCASLGAMPAISKAHASATRTPHGPRHCPMDDDMLRRRVKAAFDHHNANALAGLMLWHGYGAREATDVVEQLAELVRLPFLGFAHTDKPAHPSTSPPPWPPLPPLTPASATSIAPDTLTITLGNPAQPEASFQIVHRDSCLWLQP